MADLTTDIDETIGIHSLGDFKPDMPTVSGRTALLHRLLVRLQTPRGRFPWWPNFGTDMSLYLLSKATPSAIAGAAQLECLKDEQVKEARATAEVQDGGRKIVLRIVLLSNVGPYKFTLAVTQAKLDLIELQAA